MRIPFPERVPLHHVAIFAGVLFLIQQLEGTALYFSVGCVAFIMLTGIAFNEAGGLARTAGAYIFFYSFLVVIIGLCYKAYLGEPAQSNLLDPKTDIEVYVGGMAALLVAAIISRRLVHGAGIMRNVLKERAMYRASIGCMTFGIFGGFLLALLGESGTRLQSAFTQLNQLIPLGIIIGVVYEIRSSGGKRSVNLPVLIGGLYCFSFYGLLNFSKQGMLLPIVCWALPVCALRYRLSYLQVIGGIAGTLFIFYYLVPYTYYVRRFSGEAPTIPQRMELVEQYLLQDPGRSRRLMSEEPAVPGYFNTGQGFWDRLNFISVDDGLINVTDEGRVFGLTPIWANLLNAIPHFIYPNKPAFNFGNTYTHELGHMSEEDVSTGISYSPTSEAYHMARWVGVFVVAPIVWCVLFVELDYLFGDLRSTPWGLLVIAQLSHTAPEGMLSGTIGLMSFGTEAFIFCAVFAAWIAPYFAIAVLGPERRLPSWTQAVPLRHALRNGSVEGDAIPPVV